MKVAKKIREVYSSTMKGDGSVGEELNFVFTIRDGNYVVQDFNHTGDIKQSLKDVVLPKISDLDQKKFAEELTDRTV
ncbi:hypothetical protein KA013_03465 [Patescibacteria group bacterium]|nr:hypothetical protein [Patescibacteria group bacterium]